MLKINALSFSYAKKPVLKDFSLQVKKGEIVALMGESGCGKSTLLQLIAGLLKPKSGEIGHDFKKISYAFQEPRLFPWLTVKENLLAVLPRGVENAEEAISQALESVELSDSAELYPDSLSGGMKSRVSLARALVFGGDLLLLDEPFSALDEALCATLATRLREYLKETNASAILVTHRSADAEALADRIIEL